MVLLASDGREMDSLEFSRWLEERRQDGRDLCFVIGGPRGLELEADSRLSLGRDDAAPPARARGAAGAALPCPQDPGPRALSLLR